MLVVKHKVRQVVSFKTRGVATLLTHENNPVILAKSSVSPPVAKDQHNDYMVGLYFNREPGDKTSNRFLISTSEMWINNSDITEKLVERRLNLEFDFKRRPVNPEMKTVGEYTHIKFSTIPFDSFEEAEMYRSHFDGWRLKGNCLKTLDDWGHWEDYYACVSVCKGSGIKVTQEGPVGLLRRMFLRAYAQNEWGLIRTMTYKELADWLTLHGFKTSVNDLRTAKRSELKAHVVPNVLSVKPLLALLEEEFPKLDTSKFF